MYSYLWDMNFGDGTLAQKRYIVHIPYRGLSTEETKRLRRYPSRRWVIERTHRWMNLFLALKIRYCRKATNFEALVHFANSIICFRMARSWIWGRTLNLYKIANPEKGEIPERKGGTSLPR